MKRALLPMVFLLAFSFCARAETRMMAAVQPTIIYFSDVPITWVPINRLPRTPSEDKETFFNWMGRALSSSGEPTLIALDREIVYQEATARGLNPVILRDSRGGIMHVAFEESDLEPLCEMAVDLGIKYVMKLRLPTSSSRINDSEPAETPLPGAATIFTDLVVSNRKVAVEYTVYHAADKKVLVTRDVEISSAEGTPGFADAQAGNSVVRTIASELAFIENGTRVLPGSIKLQKAHPLWLGFQDGVSYLTSLELIEMERIDNANIRLTFSIRNELEKTLTIEPVPEEKEELKTYLEDSLGVVYRMTPLESGWKTSLRPWERKDFSLTFKAPPLNVQKASLKSLWVLELGQERHERSLQLNDLWLHEIAELPQPAPATVPAPDPAPSQTSPSHPPAHRSPRAPR